ncbi:uncharacterized protein B4U79_11268, partial [Dinothrombium tinctorium]
MTHINSKLLIKASQSVEFKTEQQKNDFLNNERVKECPAAEDGTGRFACPSPDKLGRYRCIDDHVLCDGFIDCPNAEDEDRSSCMFFKT